jgi:hypothetical protein
MVDRGLALTLVASKGKIAALALTVLVFAGCHSACFQTARIRSGINTAFGVTKLDAGHNSPISDYSIFLKGEIGHAAGRGKPGYSLAVTLVSPLRNTYRDGFTSHDVNLGVFPNEWPGLMPEAKVQLPRAIPVDVAVDVRFMGYFPERLALLASYDVTRRLSVYESLSYTGGLGGLLAGGAEINLNPRLSVFVEYSRWLTRHDYPEDLGDLLADHPYSIGIALSYHIPRIKRYDASPFAHR